VLNKVAKKKFCPCGAVNLQSGARLTYDGCCKIIHEGQPAPSPVALMRSRYSAYALRMAEYLLHSWHPDFRPSHINFLAEQQWHQLSIEECWESGDEGKVRFSATYSLQGKWHLLKENSSFIKQNGHWFYTTGIVEEQRLTPKRNGPCPCGSGKKFKHCCLK
jgi:SEC-C motif domain protein